MVELPGCILRLRHGNARPPVLYGHPRTHILSVTRLLQYLQLIYGGLPRSSWLRKVNDTSSHLFLLSRALKAYILFQ